MQRGRRRPPGGSSKGVRGSRRMRGGGGQDRGVRAGRRETVGLAGQFTILEPFQLGLREWLDGVMLNLLRSNGASWHDQDNQGYGFIDT